MRRETVFLNMATGEEAIVTVRVEFLGEWDIVKGLSLLARPEDRIEDMTRNLESLFNSVVLELLGEDTEYRALVRRKK